MALLIHGHNKSSQSRGQCQWILHIRDYFSKYSYAYPLKSKESMEGAIALIVWVGQFGPSKIVRCGNGNKFKLLSGEFSQRGIQSAGD